MKLQIFLLVFILSFSACEREGDSSGDKPWEEPEGIEEILKNEGALEGEEESQLSESKKRAEAGDVDAEFELGLHYFKGEDEKPDFSEALKWFARAADREHAKAQFYLGGMYENGKGVEKDTELSTKWYQLAAENGYAVAQNQLGWMLANGQGLPADHSRAVYWFRMAAEKKYSVAQANLSTMYRDGKGVTQDLRLAETWWNLALESDTEKKFKDAGIQLFQLRR